MSILYSVLMGIAVLTAIVFSLLVLITGKGDAMSGGGGVRTTFKGKASFDDIMSQWTLWIGVSFMALILIIDVVARRAEAGMTVAPTPTSAGQSRPLNATPNTSTNAPDGNGAANTATNSPAPMSIPVSPSVPPNTRGIPDSATNTPGGPANGASNAAENSAGLSVPSTGLVPESTAPAATTGSATTGTPSTGASSTGSTTTPSTTGATNSTP